MMNKAAFEYAVSEHLDYLDREVCDRVKRISREKITEHPNKNFKIRVIENELAFSIGRAVDIVKGIKRALDEGRDRHVMILPAADPNYALAAHMINELNIPCGHVHTFNMDEYADEDGKTAPQDWRGGLAYWMYSDFFSRIKPELKIPDSQIHFPTDKNVNDYSKMLEDLGGADVCYGGIGWCGHIAFFEPYLGRDYVDRIDEYLELGSQMVDISLITVLQNTLNYQGNWSWCPPKAATVGPRDLKNSKLVSFWNGAPWQNFITRLSAHGPVNPLVPASILQIINSELILSGTVAADCISEPVSRGNPIFFPE